MPETRGNLNIGHELTRLANMTPRELREEYRQVFGEATRVGNKAHLIKRIAWRLQSLAEGDLSERARRRAAELACDADIRTSIPRPPKSTPDAERRKVETAVSFTRDERIPPGGTLVRHYRGETHVVKVLPDGFEHQGRVFKSLSAVAKAITGSHWNGYAFFKIAKPRENADA